MSKKLYYCEELVNDDERCYSNANLLDIMREKGIKEAKAFLAKPEIISDQFYCQEEMKWGKRNDYTCGSRNCVNYKPRNGKSGCCVHYTTYSYEPTDKFIILKIK